MTASGNFSYVLGDRQQFDVSRPGTETASINPTCEKECAVSGAVLLEIFHFYHETFMFIYFFRALQDRGKYSHFLPES